MGHKTEGISGTEMTDSAFLRALADYLRLMGGKPMVPARLRRIAAKLDRDPVQDEWDAFMAATGGAIQRGRS